MKSASKGKMNNQGHKSIAILICYFGELPWYFDYFVHSCKYNLTVDIIFITDRECLKPLPENFKWVRMTIDEFQQVASEKLGFAVNVQFGYKLCDFKPAYGFIFSDLIKDYDFWGQSDIDVIYGNIRNFFDEDMLEEYDFISVRHDYTSGCFALYRNNMLMNTIFTRSKDFKTVYSNPEYFGFDECSFKHHLLFQGESIFDITTEIESFTHIIREAQQKEEIKAFFDYILIENVPGRIKFDRGKVTVKHKYEGILYHLYWLKRVYNPKKMPTIIPDTYYISPTRIYFR